MARPRKLINITWLGEDDLHGEEGGPGKCIWNGITFKKDEVVAVSDPHMIMKAKGNPFFSVEGHVKDEETEAE